MDWAYVLQQVQRFGFEYVFKRFPGVYEANVTDVRDPEKRGRIRAAVPGIGAREASSAWFTPAFPQAGPNRGWFHPPNAGDSVLVTFQNGDPSRPHRYFGGWYGNPDGASEVPTELGYDTSNPPQPLRTGFVSRVGHALIFDETPGSEAVELRWHQPAPGDPALSDPSKTADRARGKTSRLRASPDGSVTLASASGAEVTLDATGTRLLVKDQSGNSVTLAQGGIAISAKSGASVTVTADEVKVDATSILLGGRSFRAVVGEKLLEYLRSHQHGSGTGPTSAPLVPPSDDLLSRTVRLKE